MSNQKHTGEQKQDFWRRLAAIELMIPEEYSKIIAERKNVSKEIVKNVRHGRTIDFIILAALEDLCHEVADKMNK